uniref:Uncharacterized protein n=1 Tax=Arundo donax TaxID=35708 RepID=A0A0A9AWH8_ARUDO
MEQIIEQIQLLQLPKLTDFMGYHPREAIILELKLDQLPAFSNFRWNSP